MGRKRTKPYTETSVYAEYWSNDAKVGKSICFYAFSRKFPSTSTRKGKDAASIYVEHLREALEIADGISELRVKMHTVLITPNKD